MADKDIYSGVSADEPSVDSLRTEKSKVEWQSPVLRKLSILEAKSGAGASYDGISFS